jgi:hypothetical protein
MKATRTVLAALAVALVALAFTGSTGATPPQPLTGSGVLTSFNVTDSRTAGPNTILHFTATITSTGTLTGTYVGQGLNVIYPDGRVTVTYTYTFTGSSPCGTGSFEISGVGPGAASGIEAGHYTSVDDASNTIGIHVNIDFSIDLNAQNPVYSFTGTYNCK